MSDDLCVECGLGPDMHRANCSVRRQRKVKAAGGRGALEAELVKWRTGDGDVAILIGGVMKHFGADSLGDLDDKVLAELHDNVRDFLDEAPPLAEGDPAKGAM